MTSPHAQAVLLVSGQLTASDHTVISANTDEDADPQIFAQSPSGELAFYFVRPADADLPPASADAERFRALAAKHDVAAYYVSVSPDALPPRIDIHPL